MTKQYLLPLLFLVLSVFSSGAFSPVFSEAPSTGSPVDAMGVFHGVVREAANGLPGYTIYRPADLEVHDKFPVVAWSNGACASSNDGHLYFLMQLAAHGFVVIAAGAPEASSSPGGVATEDRLSRAIDWATSNGKDAPEFRKNLDTSKIATMGHSCGGIDAIRTGANDDRVKSVVSLNSGCHPDTSNGGASGPLAVCRGELDSLKGPIMFMTGGPSDIAHNNSVQNYNLVSIVPSVFASHSTAGHSGFFGENTARTVQLQAVQAVVEWLDATLNGNEYALTFLIGPNAELGSLDNWVVESKGF